MVISPIHYIFVPLATAFLIPLLQKLYKDAARVVPGLVLFYNLVISVILFRRVMQHGTVTEIIAGWRPPFGINLMMTPFSATLASLVSFMAFAVWLYGFRFKRVLKGGEVMYYEILQLMMIAGALGIILTGDLFNLFVFIEITGITAISLVAFYRDRHGAEAGFKYMLLGSLASSFLLLGILLIYTQTGTLNMAQIAQKMPAVDSGVKVIALIFILIALGIEAEMFPLNSWAPDAYSQAPSPTSATFASVLAVAALYALIRVGYTLFDARMISGFLIVMGFLTMLIAEMAAFSQTDLKRMLAYSSIGQMGLAMVAFGIGNETAIFGALFLMINHAVIKALLFMSGSYFIYNLQTKKMDALNGIHKRLPYVSFLFSLGVLAIIGFPPFSGFWSKLYILYGAANKNMLLLIIGILSITLIEMTYYLRVIGRIYFAKEKSEPASHKPSVNALVAMTALALVIIILGIYPDLISGYLHQAGRFLLDKQAYIQTVLSMR